VCPCARERGFHLGRRAVQKARIGGNGEKRTNRADEFNGRERGIRRGWKEGEDDGVEDPREGGTGGGALECRMEGVWGVRGKQEDGGFE
jgi:hypothetical protein